MVYQFRFPDVGEGIAEGVLVTWKVKVGERIKEDQALGDIETAKALVEIPSPKSGTVLQLHVVEGQTIHVGDVLVTIGEPGEKIDAAPKKTEEKREIPSLLVKKQRTEILALPATRQKAKELGIDISAVKGTGKDGIISVADVIEITKKTESKESHVSFDNYGRIMRMPLTGMRKAIAENMVLSKQTIPHVTHIDEADVTVLDSLRKSKKEYADNKGIHLTLLPFIIKAAISALKKFPYLNASFDSLKQEIVVKEYYNIGVAVDTAHGLYVPVLKEADKMSVLFIAQKIEVLATHCKQKDITPQDLTGATFSVTNIGSYGGIAATPIIPPGQAGILGLYRMKEKPVVHDGGIVARKIMPLSITFDHRIVDGATAAKFMNELINHLEDTELMVVD